MADVAPALEKEGFATHCAPADPLHLVDEIRLAALPARSLECYVQLPMTDLRGCGQPSVAALRALVADALLARFDALAVVVPLLAPGARLVIVAGDRAGTTSDSDLGLPDISGVLAEAVLASHGAHNIHPTVIDDDICASDIAGIARARVDGPGPGSAAGCNRSAPRWPTSPPSPPTSATWHGGTSCCWQRSLRGSALTQATISRRSAGSPILGGTAVARLSGRTIDGSGTRQRPAPGRRPLSQPGAPLPFGSPS